MSDLQFDSLQNEFGRPPQEKPGFDLSGMLVRWGLVSSRQEATYVLIVIGILALVGAYVLYGALSGGSNVPTTPIYSR